MSTSTKQSKERVLDPVERSSEVLFGLIMVLSFTGSISVISAEREEVREVLLGAIGCNLAWGIIDAVLYLVMLVVARARIHTLGHAVRASATPEAARKLLAQAVDEPLGELFDDAALERARAKLLAHAEPPARESLHWRDWQGAIGVFLLVTLSTFPVVLPFVFFTPMHTAMRVSNGVAIVMLFLAGHTLGRYAGLRPVRTGLLMVAIGAVLVAITMALGG